MKIQTTLIREGGTHVKLGDMDYHFAPQEDGAHVATVTDEDDAAELLKHPEGYRVYKPKSSGAQPTEEDISAAQERDKVMADYKAKFGKFPPGMPKINLDKVREAIDKNEPL